MSAATTIATDMGIGPGDVISGRYRVVRVIGHGGMGVVVEAVHLGLGQRVAIKFLRPHLGVDADDEATTRFVAEAKALGQLKSMHFPRVTDVAAEGGTPYFVMEYLDGHDLGAALAVDGVLSVATAVDYALQVCEALAEAYKAGIVHRDIKPANLFLTPASDGSTLVKVLDFGISKYAPASDVGMTATRALMGSPRYMAPEAMRSMRRVDHRADIWSLGIVMHEALTGHAPFVGETLPEVCAAIAADDPVRVRQLRRDVPIELQDVILRCLAKDPEQRYADVAALAADLVPFASADAAVMARRVARIIRGASQTVPPPRIGMAIPTIPPPSSAAVVASGLPRPGELPAFAPSSNLAPLSGPPPRKDRGRRWMWVLAVVVVVAIPAFVVGAFVSSPADTPASAP